MTGHTWSHLGDTVSDATCRMYYRGQRIREAYYRGEKIWGEDRFLGIRLANLPNKLHYGTNETLDYTGVKILGVWASGRTEDITAECEFYPEEGTAITPSDILVGIVIAQLPNKQLYGPGERFNYAGTVINAVYADGHTVDVTSECKFSPDSGKPADECRVRMTGIVITQFPTKMEYASGETISYDGIKVRAFYSNERSVDVTSDCAFIPADGSVA